MPIRPCPAILDTEWPMAPVWTVRRTATVAMLFSFARLTASSRRR